MQGSGTRIEIAVAAFVVAAVLVAGVLLAGPNVLTGPGDREDSAATTAALAHVAIVYDEAIREYVEDHDGAVPDAVGSSTWPVAAEGPRSTSRRHGRYVAETPPQVLAGRIGIGVPTRAGWIDYVPARELRDYELLARTTDGVITCGLGTRLRPGVPRCA